MDDNAVRRMFRRLANGKSTLDFTGFCKAVDVAVGETVILLRPPPPLVGVSIAMERERQQNDSLADG